MKTNRELDKQARENLIKSVLGQYAQRYKKALYDNERAGVDLEVIGFLDRMPYDDFIKYIKFYREKRGDLDRSKWS